MSLDMTPSNAVSLVAFLSAPHLHLPALTQSSPPAGGRGGRSLAQQFSHNPPHRPPRATPTPQEHCEHRLDVVLCVNCEWTVNDYIITACTSVHLPLMGICHCVCVEDVFVVQRAPSAGHDRSAPFDNSIWIICPVIYALYTCAKTKM